MSIFKDQKKCQEWAWLALRLGVAFVLVVHGYGKLFGGSPGMDAFTGMITKLGFPVPVLTAYLVAILEFFGGLAIAFGLYTKYVSALVVIQFAVILLYVKKLAFPFADVDLLVFVIAIALALTGAGGMSCDSKMMKKKS